MGLIMVVDDSAIVRALVSATLAEHGHDVVEAENGEEFLELAAEQPYDLILLDIMMPVKNGVDALREFRQGGASTPVVVVSSKTEAALADVFDDYQISGHLIKPLTPADLVGTVAGLV